MGVQIGLSLNQLVFFGIRTGVIKLAKYASLREIIISILV